MSGYLSNLGTPKIDADEQTNVTGQLTTILAFSPVDGLQVAFRNRVDGKGGIPIAFDLRDSNGDPLPLDTEVCIRFDAPHLDQPEIVSAKLSNIRQYLSLTIQEQQSDEYRDRTRITLNGSALVVEDTEEMQVAINASEQVDWSQSEAYVDEEAVDVRSGD